MITTLKNKQTERDEGKTTANTRSERVYDENGERGKEWLLHREKEGLEEK